LKNGSLKTNLIEIHQINNVQKMAFSKYLTQSVPLKECWGPNPCSKGVSTAISTIITSLDFDEIRPKVVSPMTNRSISIFRILKPFRGGQGQEMLREKDISKFKEIECQNTSTISESVLGAILTLFI